MRGLDSIISEVATQNVLELTLPFTAPEFSHPYHVSPIEVSLGPQSAQEIAPNSSFPLRSIFDPSNSLPQTVAPADTEDRRRTCVIWSASTPPPSLPLAPPAIMSPSPKWQEIPQRDYGLGPRQWNYIRLEPVLFPVKGLPGINMRDALYGEFTALEGRDDRVLRDARQAISCRLLVRLSCRLHFFSYKS